MTEPPADTRLFRRGRSDWGVPAEKRGLAEFVLTRVQADFDLGLGVRAIKWFHAADPLAQDGDLDVFRASVYEAGYVARDDPATVWLRRELCALSDAALTRVLVHELVHAEALARGRPLTVAEHERLANDVTAIICRGVVG